MKISKQKQISSPVSIQKSLVIRQTQIDRFWSEYNYNQSQSETWNTCSMNFFGIGGIGKSKLCESLCQELEKNKKQFISLYFEEANSLIQHLLIIRNLLNQKYNFQFPFFDLAYIEYYKKIGKTVEQPQLQLFLSNKWLETAYPILNVIPKVNIFAAIAQSIKIVEPDIAQRLNDNKLFEEIYFFSPEELYKRIPYYFMLDVYKIIEFIEEPLVIFIDNFDGKELHENEFFNWIFGKDSPILQLPNIVWTFFSREEIKKHDINIDIKNIPVDSFDLPTARDYLLQVHVDSDLVNEIYTLTDGIPIYLEICVDAYYEAIRCKEKVNFSTFQNDRNKLIKVYTNYLDKDKKLLLDLMSCLSEWNDEIFIKLLDILNMDYLLYDYEEMKNKSFIFKRGSMFYLHHIVRNVVFENINQTLLTKVQNSITKLCEETNLFHEKLELLSLEIKLRLINSEAEFINFFCKYLAHDFKLFVNNTDLPRMYEYYYTIEKFLRTYDQVYFINAILELYYGKLLSKIGDFSNAIKHLQLAYEYSIKSICPQNFNMKNYQLILRDIKGEYSNCLLQIGEFDSSIKFRKELCEEIAKSEGTKSYFYTVAQQNYATSLIYSKKDIAKGLQIILKVIKKRNKIILKDTSLINLNLLQTLFALHTAAEAYEMLEDYTNALHFSYSAYSTAQSIYGPNDFHTYSFGSSLANILLHITSYEPALRLLEEIYSHWKTIMPKSSPLLCSLMYSLGIAYGECGQPSKGKDLLYSLYLDSLNINGEFDKITLKYKKEYAICLSHEGNNIEALEILYDILNIYNRYYYNDMSEQYFMLIFSIIRAEINLKNYDKATTIFEDLKNSITTSTTYSLNIKKIISHYENILYPNCTQRH